MSSTPAWLQAAGVITLLLFAYSLKFWARRALVYLPIQERRASALTGGRPAAPAQRRLQPLLVPMNHGACHDADKRSIHQQ